MVETEGLAPARGQGGPVESRRFQQDGGAQDIGAHEVYGPVDGPVVVALGRQVHQGVRLVALEDGGHSGGVADVGPLEGIVRRGGDRGHIVQAGGVGEGVEIHDLAAVADRLADHGRSDESCAARDDEFHLLTHFCAPQCLP